MSNETYTAAAACRDADRAIQRADEIANSDSPVWDRGPGGREATVQCYLLRGIALGLLSIAANLETFRASGLPIEDVNRL